MGSPSHAGNFLAECSVSNASRMTHVPHLWARRPIRQSLYIYSVWRWKFLVFVLFFLSFWFPRRWLGSLSPVLVSTDQREVLKHGTGVEGYLAYA